MKHPLVGLAAASLLLGGCLSKDMGDLKRYVEEVKSRPPAPIEPIPEFKAAPTFLYSMRDRRDPFMPEEEPDTQPVAENLLGPKPDENRPKEELESYSLDTLRMVGTLEQKTTTWGLVQTKDGTIHRVKRGNYLGMNHGQILRIAEDRIELTELIPSGGGAFLERETALALGEE